MYIDEKKSLEEIMEYFKNQGFTPRYGSPMQDAMQFYSTATLLIKDVVAFRP